MAPLRATREVTFMLPNQVGLYTLLPIIEEVLRRHVTVYVACRHALADTVHSALSLPPASIVPLEPIERRNRALGRLHRLLMFTFTGRDFSSHYREFHDLAKLGGPIRNLMWRLGNRMPSWPPLSINTRVQSYINPLMRNPFPSRRIIALSQTSQAHLLCARGQNVVTVMESWDHPYKAPAGFCSETVVAWNASLAADWTQFQGEGDVVVGYPLKLRYALAQAAAHPVTDTVGRRPTALYAASTSSLTAYPGWFSDECRLIRAICVATADAGFDLTVKPKPAGMRGEFDQLAREFPHVRIGTYREGPARVDYYLDDDYNNRRLHELAGCDVVISSGTTFALDAAAAGRPVLQLDLRGSHEFPVVARAADRYHIASYLMGDASLVFRPGSFGFASEMASYLGALDNRPRMLSEHLREWLAPRDFDEAVSSIADTVLSSKG